MVYLALAGGGVPALGFEVGGLCALEKILNPESQNGEKLNDLITGYQGVSAGAIVSTLMALGFAPHVIRDVMLEQSAAFPSLTRTALGTQPMMYVTLVEQLTRGILRTMASVLSGLLKLDLPMIWLPGKHTPKLSFSDMRVLARLVRYGAFEQANVNNVIHNVLDTIKGGLYTPEGIGQYIKEVISEFSPYEDNFQSLTKELYLYAAELNSSQVRVFATHGEHLPYELVNVPISKCVEISCAIPVFFKPVYLQQTGKYYTDGGVIKSLHLQNLIDRINYVRPSYKTPAVILTFFPFVPPVFPAGSDYTNLSVLEMLSLSLKMTYLEKFNTALRSYRNEEENNIYIQIFKPSRHSKTARTHPLQDISIQQIAQLNYEGEVSVYRSFLNDYDRLKKVFSDTGIEIAPREEIVVLLKACRKYYGLKGISDDEPSTESSAPELPTKNIKKR
jgi:predicted acylesterase/phospholipase RssA